MSDKRKFRHVDDANEIMRHMAWSLRGLVEKAIASKDLHFIRIYNRGDRIEIDGIEGQLAFELQKTISAWRN